MKKYLPYLGILMLSLFTMEACSVLNQINQAKNFARCEFRLNSVNNITLAGINVQNLTSRSQLNLLDAGRLALALSQNSLPLNLTLNVDVKNPNAEAAGLNRLDWRMFIDDSELLQNTLSNRTEIPGNGGTAVLPLQVGVNLKQILSGKPLESIGNFAFNLAGEGNKPTRFMLRVKPTLDVMGFNVEYPDYFDVKTEFTAGQGRALRDALGK
jgi:hypothetical protein